MKRLKLFLPLIAAMLFVSISHADQSDRQKDKSKLAVYSQSFASTVVPSTSVVLIDLSDTTNFPHKETDRLYIHSICVDIDKVAATTTTVKVGVVNYIDASSSTVTWFKIVGQDLNVSNTNPKPCTEYLAPLDMRITAGASITEGAVDNAKSNQTTNSTTFKTDVRLPSTNGNIYPGLGDIVATITKGGAAVNYTFEIVYSSSR